MPTVADAAPYWANLVVWGVVNAVNLLQATGFLSRVFTGKMDVNHVLGWGVMALAVPAGAALVAFGLAGAGWLHRAGPAAFILFTVFMAMVDYLRPIPFRSPARPGILVPFLVLFFGSILLMGLPMYRLNRGLWLVTAVTSALLLISMCVAMRRGVA
ncbi:MAG: hypothetical protein KA419_18385 [Acidobacteria bacterium]|nr:hypothetical protein [Acidobacteriota bacterium]